MDNTNHCILCDNKIVDFKTGVLCNLTNRKPDFQEKCNVIKLDNEFKSKITETNIEYEAVLKTRIDVYGNFILFLLIALAVFIGGFLFGKYVLEIGVISTVPIIIIGIGIVPLGMAFGPLNHYLSSVKIAKEKKVNIDKIARLYGYDYDIKIKHLKDSLGNKSHKTNLHLKKTSNSNS